jgi:hypothetical protein
VRDSSGASPRQSNCCTMLVSCPGLKLRITKLEGARIPAVLTMMMSCRGGLMDKVDPLCRDTVNPGTMVRKLEVQFNVLVRSGSAATRPKDWVLCS